MLFLISVELVLLCTGRLEFNDFKYPQNQAGYYNRSNVNSYIDDVKESFTEDSYKGKQLESTLSKPLEEPDSNLTGKETKRSGMQKKLNCKLGNSQSYGTGIT